MNENVYYHIKLMAEEVSIFDLALADWIVLNMWDIVTSSRSKAYHSFRLSCLMSSRLMKLLNWSETTGVPAEIWSSIYNRMYKASVLGPLNPEYLKAVSKVRKIDGKAADYLLDKAPLLRSFDKDDPCLTSAFCWSEASKEFRWIEICAFTNKEVSVYGPRLKIPSFEELTAMHPPSSAASTQVLENMASKPKQGPEPEITKPANFDLKRDLRRLLRGG